MEIIKIQNPLTLANDFQVVGICNAETPNQIIEKNALVFTRPFFLLVNGKPVLRAEWDCPLTAGAVCHFVELPRGGDGGSSNPLQIIATIAVIVLSVYTGGLAAAAWGKMAGALVQGLVAMGGMLVVNAFFGGQATNTDMGQIEQPNAVYSLTGSRNRLQIGQPFVEHFGRFICFPDLAMIPYSQMENNDHYLYFLGIIGVGKYSIEGVYIDKTPLLDYAGTFYKILPPGTAPSLCPRVVWTCSEIANQELTTTWLTAALSAVGTQTLEIGFDIIFPSGLVRYNDRADKQSTSVAICVQARQIDGKGAGLNAWTTIRQKTYTAADKDPVRFSEKVGAPYGSGRYEVRIRRTSEKSSSNKVIDSVMAGGFRAYGPTHPDYGDVTMIECRLKATDQINGDAASRINVVATRKLKAVASWGLSAIESESRCIVDTCAYIVTGYNGGKQPVDILDFASLSALKTKLSSAEKYFDWRFVSRSSVMDACAKAAKCGRAVPFMPSGRFSLVQDRLQPVHSQTYTEDDYTEGTFDISHAIRTEDSPTCIQIEYVDPDTWQMEQVTCMDDGGSTQNPAVVKLEGCTSRQHAWEEGMYMYWDDEMNRSIVTFTTGLKGHIPCIGKKLLVSANMSDWGQTGLIADIDPEQDNIWLSEPLDFKGQSEGHLYLTVPSGDGVLGPWFVRPSDYAHCVKGSFEGETVRTQKADGEKAAKYIFGPAETEFLNVRLVRVLPQGQNAVRLVGNVIHDAVYKDPGPAPALPGLSGVGFLENVFVGYAGPNGENNAFKATWSGRAVKFKVEHTNALGNYVLDSDNFTQYQKSYETSGSSISVRITPYDDNTLKPDLAKIATATLVPPVTGLQLAEPVGDSVSVKWTAVSDATSYDVAILKDGQNKGQKTVTAAYASIPIEDIKAMGGPWPSFDVMVWANKGMSQSRSVTLPVVVGSLPKVTGFALQARLENGVTLSWGEVPGATGYKVYSGPVDGFTPGAEGSALVYNGLADNIIVSGLSMTGSYHYWFRVAATNGYVTANDALNWSDTLNVTPVTLTCTAGMATDLEAAVSGNAVSLSWGGSATQFDIRIEQDGQPDRIITRMTGSQRTITGLIPGSFEATVTPYLSDGSLCSGRAINAFGTII